MNKILKHLKEYWLLYFIVCQPIIDVIAYFQTKVLGNSFSWIIRIVMLLVTFVFIFINSKNKKRLFFSILPFGIYFILHILNLYRINSLRLILDVKYFILVFQMPILTIMLIDYIKYNPKKIELSKFGIVGSFFVILLVIFLSYLTNSYEITYEYSKNGIIGWFTGSNTPSMILCAVCPWVIYYFSNKKTYLYFIMCLFAFVLLYFNATKACYLTLVTSFILSLFSSIVSKDNKSKVQKAIISGLFVFLSIIMYQYSFTYINRNMAVKNIEENTKEIDKIINNNDGTEEINKIINNKDGTEDTKKQINDFKNMTDEEILEALKISHIYAELIEIQGKEKVIKFMRNNITAENLANNRLLKVINARIETDNSDFITKILGVGYSSFAVNDYDLETDLDAIYFYYGYLGFALYIGFILYFVVLLIIKFITKPSIICDAEYLILCYLIPLLVLGGQYSGAFLRKPNANIYLTIFLLLTYFKCKDFKITDNYNKNKITFLLLHLGFGGIESATINSANALSEYYDVELVSFYNLKDNQTKQLNKKVKIKYLYDGEPNKKEISSAIKKLNIIKIFKEGFKAIDILYKKNSLIKKEIINCDSFAIVSTRVEFSTQLSKYGRDGIIKIAQEHHHHNNNKKYINCLKYKYKNIDYLCALTKNLQKDYKKFLEKINDNTKIILLPNMIIDSNFDISDLNNKNIISVGRLEEGKKVDELITIFNDLNIKDSQLFIIGSGSKEAELKQLVNQLNINDKVKFLGYLNSKEQQKYYLKSSLFAMTSITEGLPMVLLEAMQHGLPCIAYETDSGVNDIIKNSKNGYVIKNRNQKDYVKKLKSILLNKKIKNGMQKEALKTVEKFSSDNILKIWFKILKQGD